MARNDTTRDHHAPRSPDSKPRRATPARQLVAGPLGHRREVLGPRRVERAEIGVGRVGVGDARRRRVEQVGRRGAQARARARAAGRRRSARGHEALHALHERDERAVAHRRPGRAVRGARVRLMQRQRPAAAAAARRRGRTVRAHEARGRRGALSATRLPERRPLEHRPEHQRHHGRDEPTEAPSPRGASGICDAGAGERRREHERERRGEHARRPRPAERGDLHDHEADDQRHDAGEDGLLARRAVPMVMSTAPIAVAT